MATASVVSTFALTARDSYDNRIPFSVSGIGVPLRAFAVLLDSNYAVAAAFAFERTRGGVYDWTYGSLIRYFHVAPVMPANLLCVTSRFAIYSLTLSRAGALLCIAGAGARANS